MRRLAKQIVIMFLRFSRINFRSIDPIRVNAKSVYGIRFFPVDHRDYLPYVPPVRRWGRGGRFRDDANGRERVGRLFIRRRLDRTPGRFRRRTEGICTNQNRRTRVRFPCMGPRAASGSCALKTYWGVSA